MDMPKKTIVGAAIFAALNAAWMYVFSLMNLGLTDLFDYNIYLKFLNASLILMFVVVGLLIAAAIVAVLYATGGNKKIDLAAFGGGASAIIAYAIFNSIFASLLMLFFTAGIALFILSRKGLQEPGGLFAKLKFGWGGARKIMTIFAIGAFLTSLLFGFMNKDACEAKAKESLTSVALKSMGNGLDLQNILSKDDVKNMLCGSVTRESVLDIAKAQLGDAWNQLSKAAQDDLVDKTYNQSKNNCNDENYINQAYATMQKNLGNANLGASQPMIEKLLENMPIMKTLLQLMPIISAFVLFSAVNLFGTIFVAPFSALFSLGLKNDQNKPEDGQKSD